MLSPQPYRRRKNRSTKSVKGGRTADFQLQSLESRMMMSGTPAVSAAVAASVPALNSLPTASAKLYLDFVGDTSDHSTPAFTQDGDASTFSSGEISAIKEIWSRVSEKYSPFNINVTTVDPGALNDKQTLRVLIGGNGAWNGANTTGSGGYSWVGSFYNSAANTSYVFSTNLVNNAKYVSEAAAHEAGHGFGLNHQSTASAEYNPGDSLRAPIMGSSYFATRGLWWMGSSQGTTQDDLSILSNSSNGFGYRTDDFGDSTSSASTLSFSGSSFNTAGVITKTSDSDYFSFSTGGGAATFTLSGAQYGAMLDGKLQVLSSNGLVVATADTSSLGESLSLNLSAGNYFVVVGSHGGYGDIGQYTLTGTASQGQAPVVTVTAPTSLAATAASSSRINLSWADNSSNETGFVVERSTDGSNFTAINSPAAGSTSYGDTSVSSGTTYYYRVKAVNGSTNSGYTSIAAATTPVVVVAPTAASNLVATAASSTRVNLTWADNSNNETGFVVERSTDGANFSAINSPVAGSTSYADNSVTGGATYYYRVKAVNGSLNSGYTATASATTPVVIVSPNAPSVLVATANSQTSVQLNWADNSSNETGFKIERSTSGGAFVAITNVAGGSTNYTDSSAAANTTYTYRVSAFNTAGSSAVATSSNVTTPPVVVNLPAPGAPTGVTAAAAAKGRIRITWSVATGNPDGYIVERSTNGQSWSQVATLGATATGCTNSGLARGTTYYYRVRAFNENGSSAFSSIVSSITAGPGVKSAAQAANVPAASSTPSNVSSSQTSPANVESNTNPTSSNSTTKNSETVSTTESKSKSKGKHASSVAAAPVAPSFAQSRITWAARISNFSFDDSKDDIDR